MYIQYEHIQDLQDTPQMKRGSLVVLKTSSVKQHLFEYSPAPRDDLGDMWYYPEDPPMMYLGYRPTNVTVLHYFLHQHRIWFLMADYIHAAWWSPIEYTQCVFMHFKPE